MHTENDFSVFGRRIESSSGETIQHVYLEKLKNVKMFIYVKNRLLYARDHSFEKTID